MTARFSSLFGFTPDDIDVTYSNKGLLPWQGGMTTIEDGTAHIRLRTAFKKGRFLWYTTDEVLAHEMVHLVRKDLDEPQFEEILAYQTSRSPFRRYFGPLFRTSFESLLAIGSLTFLLLPGLQWVPPLLWALALSRLMYSQRLFKRALKKCPLSELIHMRDAEIRA